MRTLIVMVLVLIGSSLAVKDLTPTLWGNALIDDGGSLGLNLDYGTSERFAWGTTFGFGIFRDYYVLYPGVQGRFYFSDRSMGPVRLYLNTSVGPGLGAQNRTNGETDFTLGGFGSFSFGGDFISCDSITPTVMLGGFADKHAHGNITALLLGLGIRF